MSDFIKFIGFVLVAIPFILFLYIANEDINTRI